MLTLEQIREDLKDIRYYYARKQIFDAAVQTVGIAEIIAKVERYNRAARAAPPRLFDLYISLYIKNNTQEGLAMEMGYTTEYIQIQNKKLVLFLQSKLAEGGVGK